MKIVVDKNIPGVEETFARHGRVVAVDGRQISSDVLTDATALITRSITRVDADLLTGTEVAFVGTATIGTDHLDIPLLEHLGIHWASAPGCNADATAQYTIAMTLLACKRLGLNVQSRSVGIVGYGNVGSRVRQLYEGIGLDNIKVCDPPLAEGGVDNLCDPAEIKDCDIISLHVPLSGSGPHTTLNMVNTGFLSDLRQGTLLVNTSRGKVTEKQALTDWLIAGRGHAALDVWPEEPAIDPELLERCSVATPHVAGYSLDGKIKGTMMIYDEFCRWLKSPGRPLDPSVKLPVYEMPERQVNELSDAILVACPVQRDDQNLRTLLTRDLQHQSAHFDDLRKDYPERRDFSGWRIPQGTNDTLAEILQTLGFI